MRMLLFFYKSGRYRPYYQQMITPFLCKVIPVIGVNLKEGFKFISILTCKNNIYICSDSNDILRLYSRFSRNCYHSSNQLQSQYLHYMHFLLLKPLALCDSQINAPRVQVLHTTIVTLCCQLPTCLYMSTNRLCLKCHQTDQTNLLKCNLYLVLTR